VNLSGGGSAPVFNNSGTVLKSAGAADTQIASSIRFNNTGGTIDVRTGTLTLPGEGASTGGTFLASAGAAIELTGGPSNATYSGTFAGAGAGAVRLSTGGINTASTGATFNFPGTLFQWTAGAIRASAAAPFTNAATGVINVSGATFKTASGRFDNAGRFNHGGAGTLDLHFGSAGANIFTNLTGATYDFQADGDISGLTGGGSLPAFNNAGTLVKSGGTDISEITSLIPFSNTGIVEVRAGTLRLGANPAQFSGTVLSGGTWRVFAGATLAFPAAANIATNAGTILLSGAASQFTAANALANNSGSFTIADGRNFTTVGQLANTGTITVGNGSTLTLTGTLNCASGALNIGSGGKVVVGSGATGLMESSEVFYETDGAMWEDSHLQPTGSVPEPGVVALLLSGVLAAAVRRRRK
jgi:hypothetical protein